MGLDGSISPLSAKTLPLDTVFVSVLLSSGVVVPIDKELSNEEIKYILSFSDCEAVIYSAGAIEKKISEIEGELPNITITSA
jgi:long-subunit acyl-CoA synthetase (AMP-forming)